MTNEELLKKQMNDEKYYTIEDLRMNRKHGFLLSQHQLTDFLLYKDGLNEEHIIKLPLKAWNYSNIYYVKNQELSNGLADYLLYFKEDIELNSSLYVDRNFEEIAIGIICSELEGTLKIEGVNTTRRQIEAILKNANTEDKNSKIITNMYNGLRFIYEKPKFTKENLKRLYDILSMDCLGEDDFLGDKLYRDDVVYIGNHIGCPMNSISECMDSLFEFVNHQLKDNNPQMSLLTPFIAHYYFVYIHPYFDYNGRTARMVQLWIFLLSKSIPSLYLSEAINDNKSMYYKALDNTRNSHNDLSYILIYLVKLCNTYYTVYKNLDAIKEELESEGETISNSELQYLKRIIINKNIQWFNYKAFMAFAGLDISKQGALKILNSLESKGLLYSKLNSSKEKIFILNEDCLVFEI